MNLKDVQTELAKRKLYSGEIDGINGKNTMRGVDAALASVKESTSWSDARKLVGFEQLVYKELGYDSGRIDGLVGPQTNHNREIYEDAKAGAPASTTKEWRDAQDAHPAAKPAKPAKPASFPGVKPQHNANHKKWPTQAGVRQFYGEPGSNQVMLETPFPMRLAWEPTTEVHRFSCHAKVHDSMVRIWKSVLDQYGIDEIRRLRLDMFGGCLNVRKMRGGNAWSMHSWGIAMDVDPDRNQLKFHRAQAELDDAPYAKYWDAVYAEGAIGLGPERDYDWMHFQFANL